jgi:phenylalanyl-tRNA synthetase alpha chain
MSPDDAVPADGAGQAAGAPSPRLVLTDADAWWSAVRQRIEAVSDLAVLEELEHELTGRRSQLVQARQNMKTLPAAQRPVAGQVLKRLQDAVTDALRARREAVAAQERQRRTAAERLDLTEVVAGFGARTLVAAPRTARLAPSDRQGKLHLVERTRQALEDVFLGMGFVVADGPEVETDWYNFEALNMPPAHPARGMFDTFYLDLDPPDTVLLRTHTSPVQVRLLQATRPPVCAVMPGRCYRRETPDARHLPTFHQVEGLVVDEGVTFGDLAGTIETFTAAYFGDDIHARLRPAFFPFTEPSAEFEITCTICRGAGCRTCSGTGWVELGGCGMVDPAVLEAVDVDPERYSGFAFGFGIDRCAQMRHGIADMRVLLENDVRFLRQA